MRRFQSSCLCLCASRQDRLASGAVRGLRPACRRPGWLGRRGWPHREGDAAVACRRGRRLAARRFEDPSRVARGTCVASPSWTWASCSLPGSRACCRPPPARRMNELSGARFDTAVLNCASGTCPRSRWGCLPFAFGRPTDSTITRGGAGTIVARWPGRPALARHTTPCVTVTQQAAARGPNRPALMGSFQAPLQNPARQRRTLGPRPMDANPSVNARRWALRHRPGVAVAPSRPAGRLVARPGAVGDASGAERVGPASPGDFGLAV
jgi:hypothetical protein